MSGGKTRPIWCRASLLHIELNNDPKMRIIAFDNNFLLNQGIQTKRPIEVQNAMMKRHLLELTQSFMIPLVSTTINVFKSFF